jgi:hypothetical protein
MKKGNFELKPCDLCGSTEAIEVPHCRDYTGNQIIHICKKCGLVYVPYRRSYEEVAKAWTEEMFASSVTNVSYTAHNPWMMGRLTAVTEFIDEKIGLKGKTVFDIGGGEGVFLDMARKKGAKVFGIEPSKKNCNEMKSNKIDCFEGTIEEYKGKEKADIATMMWTFECCQNPNAMLKRANEILKDNGYIVWAGGSRILVPFKKPLHLYFNDAPLDVHPLHPSFNAIRGLFAKHGFKVVHHNRFIDNDIMIVIGQKVKDKDIPWQCDDYLKVEDFFKRWHKESLNYREKYD